jgi:hypothetical protein
MQSVSEMCRNEVDESAPLVLPTLHRPDRSYRETFLAHRALWVRVPGRIIFSVGLDCLLFARVFVERQ